MLLHNNLRRRKVLLQAAEGFVSLLAPESKTNFHQIMPPSQGMDETHWGLASPFLRSPPRGLSAIVLRAAGGLLFSMSWLHKNSKYRVSAMTRIQNSALRNDRTLLA